MMERPTSARLCALLQTSPSPEIRALGEDALRGVMNRLAAAVLKRVPSAEEFVSFTAAGLRAAGNAGRER
jgi:hypothetical protein